MSYTYKDKMAVSLNCRIAIAIINQMSGLIRGMRNDKRLK